MDIRLTASIICNCGHYMKQIDVKDDFDDSTGRFECYKCKNSVELEVLSQIYMEKK